MIARQLAAWARNLTLDDIPTDVQHEALRHVLDGIGNAVAARRLGHAEAALTVGRGLGGPPEARVLGDTARIGAPAAGMVNGVLIHALDFDDTHAGALVHPTAVVVPAALAVGEETGADGAAVLTAIVAGLELACRIGAAAPHAFHARGMHATAVVGPLGAAATAALLYGADVDTLTDALGIAGSSSSGLLEFLETGSNTKTLHPGTAVLNGIIAARLAIAGASGPASVLEGRRGLYQALADREPNTDVLLENLGSRWESASIGIKPYPSCQLMHSALDAGQAALEKLPADHDLPGSVTSITVGIHPDSLSIVAGPGTGSRTPRSEYDAKFDLPWSLAALLHDGAVTVQTYSAESIARPDVAATARKVSVHTVPDTRPAADVGATVTLTLADGTEVLGAIDASRGSTDNPLSDDALRAKFTANCTGGADSPAADALAGAVLGMAGTTVITEITDTAAALLTAT